MQLKVGGIIDEVQKAIIGKRDVIEKLIMSILANGHILIDDVPGVGKTTLAIALSRALGLKYNRIQFTPDVLPSDVVGFSVFDRQTGALRYMPGVVCDINLLLGDEINRTSSKTQSALLEAMEEGQITVDGNTYPLRRPFIVIATQNQVGTAGTQLLPHAQVDRFLIRLSIGYPDHESQMEIIRSRQKQNPLESIINVTSQEQILQMQEQVMDITVHDEIISYIARLTEATREHPMVELGVSPRGAIAISRCARARAFIMARDYVIPEDIMAVFEDVCAHRLILNQKARAGNQSSAQILKNVLDNISVPHGL